MATMYPLFFGLLLIAVCSTVGTGDRIVETQCTVSDYWRIASLRNRHIDAGARLPSCASKQHIRTHILHIAQNEIGVREATGHNDGKRVEEYLRYTHLGKGHQWCAAFVSWCYGQAGLPEPRNPWSPALFPKARRYGAMLSTSATIVETQDVASLQNNIHYADIFGIYGPSAKRINHVGLVKDIQGKYLLTIEGNSHDRVESRRRHLSTIYALADWVRD